MAKDKEKFYVGQMLYGVFASYRNITPKVEIFEIFSITKKYLYLDVYKTLKVDVNTMNTNNSRGDGTYKIFTTHLLAEQEIERREIISYFRTINIGNLKYKTLKKMYQAVMEEIGLGGSNEQL